MRVYIIHRRGRCRRPEKLVLGQRAVTVKKKKEKRKEKKHKKETDIEWERESLIGRNCIVPGS